MCSKSDQLTHELISLKLLKLCDSKKAKDAIRKILEEVHSEAVQSTIMASNRLKFVPPTPENL